MIDERGSYKTMKFESVKNDVKTTWRLIESQSNGNVMSTLDTFTNDKGCFVTYKRSEVDAQIELKNITAA